MKLINIAGNAKDITIRSNGNDPSDFEVLIEMLVLLQFMSIQGCTSRKQDYNSGLTFIE